jgi:hypothetical protein
MFLLYILDRIGSPSVVYAAVSFALWKARSLTQDFIIYALLAGVSAWYLNSLFLAINKETRLRRLGARAPSVRTWTPFNLGFIVNAVFLVVKHRSHEFWWNNFAKISKGKKTQFWTAETITLGDRVILTADDENIKAILATQFGAYGKGPQFRKEWKEFLGLSELSQRTTRWCIELKIL